MPPESHRDAISQIRATQKLPPITPPPLPVAIQKRDQKTGAWSASYPDGSINRNARKTFDAAVPVGHDVRSLSLPGGLSAGEMAMLGPAGDPYPTANPDQLQPRRVGDKAGPLKDNDVGYLNGQVWTYPVPKKEEGGPCKILFSVVEGSERVYYVGGDRKEPKELFRLPNEVSYFGNITPNITITGSGLNSYYYQYSATTLNTAPLGLGSSEIYDSRYEAKAVVPPITFYPGLYYGIFLLSRSVIEQNEFTRQLLEIDDPYLPCYMGAGVFAASATPHIGFSDDVNGSSSFTHVVHVVDRNELTSFSMSAGSANRTYLSPGTNWGGTVAYASEIKGIDFYRVFGSEGGTSDLPGGLAANSYSCNFDVVNMFQYSPEVCLMQRLTFRLPNLGVANPFTRKLFSLKDGVEREISDEGVALLRSKWVAPRMAPIRKNLMWMHDRDSPLTIHPDQDFIDLKSLNLLTNEIGSRRVKMNPLKYTNNLIHSFDYYTP